MIMRLQGTVVDNGIDWMLIDVGGVGYRVDAALSLTSKFRSGDEATVWTHEIIRDDKRSIFGFEEKKDLELFWKLITVNGVGPKVAQKILGVCPADEVRKNVAEGSADFLTKVPGVGKKTAQKIVLELHGSINLDEITESSIAVSTEDREIVDALTSLGYAPREAREMAANLPKELTTIEEKIKAVLQSPA
ncbi:Holliday junction branch migration protein RuvA [Candidatus Uhrbacteria bacterium]|jgi:holliday junction DNA helicase RuvA|nr:Holliday junction branch migration protein RuvA [Candidatus Uhrbacteria bacterium]